MSKLNRVFSGGIQIVICLILGISLSGCPGISRPPLETLLHQPDPSLKTQELRPANITVLPVKDERQAFSSASKALLLLVPLVPYVTTEMQAGPGSIVRLAPGHEHELPELITAYIRENIAAKVKMGGYDPKADFFIEPVLVKWKRIEKGTFYGLSIMAVFPILFGTPLGYESWELDFSLNLIDAITSKVILSKRYAGKIPGGILPGFGPLARIYSDYKIKTVQHRFQEDVKPFLQESLEDFVQCIQEALPPSSDKAYWANVENVRNQRTYKAKINEARQSGHLPQINIAYPKNNMRIQMERGMLRGIVESQFELKELSVSVNELPINLVKPLLSGEKEHSLNETLHLLLGDNIIKIEVVDETGLKAVKELTVVRMLPVSTPASLAQVDDSGHLSALGGSGIVKERWAVIIGVSEFEDKNVPGLQYCVRDAQAFYDWLVSPEHGNYNPDNVKLLLNQDATLDNIKDVLFNWLKQPIEEDLITIYFAGHGTSGSPDTPDNLYLLPYDINYDRIASTGFPMWDIETVIKRFVKAKKVVVIADACHSSGIGNSFDIARRGGRGIKVNPINTGFNNLSKVGNGVCVISAAGDREYSQEGKQWGGGHGVFTYYLMKGLYGDSDYNGDSYVSMGELIPYLSEQVRRATQNAQCPSVAGKFDPALTIGK